MKNAQWLTLIELMVVMAIIAILATAGLAAYSGYMKKSRDTVRADLAKNLNSSVMAYAGSNGGNPPANKNAFDQYIQSAKEFFTSASPADNTLVKDPVWGKEVCLDAAWEANQPCSFNYTAYDNGTYAISYGVEHESSRAVNFYKTTNSVVAANETTQAVDPNTQTPVIKYGIYLWSAPFIGQESTSSNTDSGVDVNYAPPGGTPWMLTVSFRSIRIDTAIASSGGEVGNTGAAIGETCSAGTDCQSGYCNRNGWPSPICSDGLNGSECNMGYAYGDQCQSGYCNSMSICSDGLNGSDCSNAGYGNQCQSGFCSSVNFCSDKSNGSICGNPADCTSNVCCTSGLYCDYWKCVTGNTGQSCESGGDCLSNYCNSWTCSIDGQPGDPCNNIYECSSQSCSWGYCD